MLRRQLGPTAWTVLEELLLEAPDDESMLVETHVRRIADGVGISKDSAARAVRRLIAHGVVTRHDGRDPGSGYFGRGVYELQQPAIAEALVLVGHGGNSAPERVSAGRRRPSTRAAQVDDRQASLFDTPIGALP